MLVYTAFRGLCLLVFINTGESPGAF